MDGEPDYDKLIADLKNKQTDEDGSDDENDTSNNDKKNDDEDETVENVVLDQTQFMTKLAHFKKLKERAENKRRCAMSLKTYAGQFVDTLKFYSTSHIQ